MLRIRSPGLWLARSQHERASTNEGVEPPKNLTTKKLHEARRPGTMPGLRVEVDVAHQLVREARGQVLRHDLTGDRHHLDDVGTDDLFF